MKNSAVMDNDSPTANMFGCEPCPKCTSVCRAPYRQDKKLVIKCDCLYEEDAKERGNPCCGCTYCDYDACCCGSFVDYKDKTP